jgi:hypothetical protein
MPRYFTDREFGSQPRTNEAIGPTVWGGIYAVIISRLADNSFGRRFPDTCPDGYGVVGHNEQMLRLTLAAEIPQIEWPLSPETLPETPAILDLLEFVAASVGQPIEGSYHSFFRHHHLSFDEVAGLSRFADDVNSMFARNGIAFELTDQGIARRLLPEGLRQTVAEAIFHTGDLETDRLLETARRQFTSPQIEVRKDALEKLWDAFERVKTLEKGHDKRERADALLNKASTARFREMLGVEAKSLTEIGNSFRIRHAETSQEILTSSEQVDYLFHRMFSFMRFVLKATGRGA